MQSIGGAMTRLIADPANYAPVDPHNESRAEEITVDEMFDLSRMPHAHCPHCGAPLETKPLCDASGVPICWCMYPEPCTNPACIEAEAQLQAERNAQREAERREQERRRREAMVREYIDASGLTRREIAQNAFGIYRPENQTQVMALEACREYAAHFGDRLCDEYDPDVGDGMGLYVYGSNGIGKSHLLKAICGELMHNMFGGVLFRTDARIYDDIKATFGRRDTSARDIVDVFKSCNLLVIDDLGKAKTTEWALEQLYEIIDTRWTYGRPVLISSNYSPDELTEHLGAGGAGNHDRAVAIMSRIAGRTDVVYVTGDDYRRRRR